MAVQLLIAAMTTVEVTCQRPQAEHLPLSSVAGVFQNATSTKMSSFIVRPTFFFRASAGLCPWPQTAGQSFTRYPRERLHLPRRSRAARLARVEPARALDRKVGQEGR